MMPAECRWLKGPLVIKPPTYRQQLTESMARVLQESGAASDERDSMRVLHYEGYAWPDIIICLPDARALAVQESVAAEMSKP